MPKQFQCNGPLRSLSHSGEDDFSQLGEQRRRESQSTVGTEQSKGYENDGCISGARQCVNEILEDQRNANVGDLGRDQAGEGEDNPPFPCPEVRQQGTNGLPVAALHRFWSGQGDGRL